MLILILAIAFLSFALAFSFSLPIVTQRAAVIRKRTEEQALLRSEELRLEKQKVKSLYLFSPVVMGVLFWLLFQKPLAVFAGVVVSLAVPSLVLQALIAKRKNTFVSQLIDSLMILSSSLKGGLSLIQSIEVLCEEMPAPTNEEFSLVLREIKMGVALEEALHRLTQRMPSEELELLISSILVARETGGDLTKVFARLISTIRERVKLKETIATYTMQGKIQGFVMSIIPVAFFIFVQKSNPDHFDVMLQNDFGRMLLVGCVVLEFVALIMIKKFSTIKV
jgi:tight adherence protein B